MENDQRVMSFVMEIYGKVHEAKNMFKKGQDVELYLVCEKNGSCGYTKNPSAGDGVNFIKRSELSFQSVVESGGCRYHRDSKSGKRRQIKYCGQGFYRKITDEGQTFALGWSFLKKYAIGHKL